jgi:hypothetical protein
VERFQKGERKKMNNKYFFCYDKSLAMFLRYDKGIEFITSGLHEHTKNKFYLFERTEELEEALAEKQAS